MYPRPTSSRASVGLAREMISLPRHSPCLFAPTEETSNMNHLPSTRKIFMLRSELAMGAIQKVGKLVLANPSAAALYRRVWDNRAKRNADERTVSISKPPTEIPDEVFEDSKLRQHSMSSPHQDQSSLRSNGLSGKYTKRVGMFQASTKHKEHPKHDPPGITSLSSSDKRVIRDLVKGYYKNSGKVITGESILSAIDHQKSGLAKSMLSDAESQRNDPRNSSLMREDSPKINKKIYQMQGYSKSKEEIPVESNKRPSYKLYRRYQELRLRNDQQPNPKVSGSRLANLLHRDFETKPTPYTSRLVVKGALEVTADPKSASGGPVNYPKMDSVDGLLAQSEIIVGKPENQVETNRRDLRDLFSKPSLSSESLAKNKRERKLFSVKTK